MASTAGHQTAASVTARRNAALATATATSKKAQLLVNQAQARAADRRNTWSALADRLSSAAYERGRSFSADAERNAASLRWFQPAQQSNQMPHGHGWLDTPDGTGPQLYASPSAIGMGDCSSAANACTLAMALSEATNGNLINLIQPGTANEPSTFYKGNFVITSSVELLGDTGGANPILDGSGSGSVLTISGGSGINLTGLTIQDGSQPTGDGGGINDQSSTADLYIDNLNLDGNTALNGGGLYGDVAANVDITNSNLSDDTASGNGGGIDFAGNDSTSNSPGMCISGSTLNDDAASRNGGAIDVGDGDTGGYAHLCVYASTMSGDTASVDGGAIDIGNDSPNSGLYVTGSTLSSDSALTDGGAIDTADGGTMAADTQDTVENSTLSHDSAGRDGQNGSTGGHGGAIDFGDNGSSATSIYVDNDQMASDSAADGGALDAGDQSSSGTTVDVESSTFTNNSATDNGGSVDASDNGSSSCSASIWMNTFTSSSAGASGGSVYVGGNTSGDDGLWDNTFSTSTATSSGGAIDLAGNDSNASIWDSNFTGTAATNGDGGAVNFGGTDPGLSLYGSTFNQNTAQGDGGAINASGANSNLQVYSSSFSSTSAEGDGGAIDLAGSNTGGANILTDTFTNSSTSGGSGGAVNIVGGTDSNLNITGDSFTTVSAAHDGGAVNIAGNSSYGPVVETDNFSSATAGLSGGAINVAGTAPSSVFSSDVFSSDSADTNGGAISLADDDDNPVTFDSTYSNDSAVNGNGGAIDYPSDNPKSQLVAENLTFADDTASNGGALELGTDSLLLTESTLSANSGGSIENADGTVSLQDNLLVGASGPECQGSGTIADGGYNLSGDASCGLTGIGSTNGSGVGPFLGVLGQYGGPAQTVPVTETSADPAVAAIPSSSMQCGGSAENGISRVAPCTIGSYGITPPMAATTVQPVGAPVGSDEQGGGSPSEPGLCPCSSSSGAPSVGDPVNPATGDFSSASVDLSLPGAGLPLEFARTYDAQAAQQETTNAAAPPPLGYGWADNLNMSVAQQGGSGPATVTEENGAELTFEPYVAESSPAWCASAENFCANAPRIDATLNETANGWTFTRLNGRQETFTFSTAGNLVGMTDPEADQITSAPYLASNGQTACPATDSCVAWTNTVSGKELVIGSNSKEQITSVFDANGSLAAAFTYTGSACTSWGVSQTPELCAAVDPGGLTTTYSYDANNAAPSLDYDMLTVSGPTTPAPTVNQYSTSGRITKQTDPTGNVMTLAYSGTNASLAGGTTTVVMTGSVDEQTLYQYSSDVLVAETTGTDSATSSMYYLRDPVSLEPDATEDSDGNIGSSSYQTYSTPSGSPVSSENALTTIDAAGDTVQHAYNSENQVWCTVDAADYTNGIRCPSTPPPNPPSPGQDPSPGVDLNFYNSADQLVATTDALGDTTIHAYTPGALGVPSGLMYCTVDPAEYKANVACPAYLATHVVGTTTSTFDSAGDRLTSTDADGDKTTWVYGLTAHPGLPASMTDPDGTTTTYTYNGEGEILKQVVSFGTYQSTTLSAYDSYGRRYCQVNPYEAMKGVICPVTPPMASSPPANVTSTFYNADGQVLQTTSPIGGTTLTAYDQAGHAWCNVGAYAYANGTRCPATEPTSPPTVGNDPGLGATITSYDSGGRVVQSTNPLGGITLTAYDATGNVAQITTESNNATNDPNVVTDYTYDPNNRISSSVTDPGTAVASTTAERYDPNGNVYCSVSANAEAAGSTAWHCPAWQPAWVTQPPSPETLYSTTPTGAQADNVTTAFDNADGVEVQTTDPDVHTTVTVVDADQRTYCTADPTNAATWLAAHSTGTYPYLCPASPPSTPPTQGSNPGYVTTVYDPAGRTVSTTDQLGDTTSYTYDPAGNRLSTIDPRSKTISYCFYWQNASGQCAAAAPAGGGSGDDLYSETTPLTSADPSGETTTFTYWPSDATETVTTPAGVTSTSYDAADDVTTKTSTSPAAGYTAAPNLTYTYNADGSRHTMVDATGTTTYNYDNNGDVTSQALTAASGSGLNNTTTGYSYYTTGDLDTVVYPSYSGHTTPTATYTYDATGTMVSVGDWLGNTVTFGHDPDGNQTSQDNAVSGSHPTGTSATTWAYDPADLAASATSTLTCGSSTGTLSQSFSGSSGSVNPDGQVTQDTETYAGSCAGPAPYQRDYSYDQSGRVVYQGSTPQGSAANNFGYNASGDLNEITGHDTSGNLDSYTQVNNATGQVSSQTPISGSNGTTSNYTYDTLGDQTKTTTGTSTTTYGYNQNGQMVSYLSPGGSATSYLYTGDGLEAAEAAPTTPRTWAVSAAPVDTKGPITAVSCATALFCVAVDGAGNATFFNGTTWSSPTSIDSTNPLEAVSCPTTTFCAATDAHGNAVTYNGTTWTAATKVDSSSYFLGGVSCPTASFCVAVDMDGTYSTYNGTTWAAAKTANSNISILSHVSCPTTTFCAALTGSGQATTFNGTTWTAPTTIDASGNNPDGISCPTATFCAAVDGVGKVITYNGTTWAAAKTIDANTNNSLLTISCPTTTYCAAFDSVGHVLTYNGTTWTAPTSIDTNSNGLAQAGSCSSSNFCVTADGSGNTVTYGGARTTSQYTWDTNSSLPEILSDGTNDYLWGPTGQPVEDINTTATPPTNNPVFMTYTPSDSSWLTNTTAGNQTGYYRYDAYGALAEGTQTTPFGYAGQYTDLTSTNPTGLTNMRARWYQPTTGNFTTVDPDLNQTDQYYDYAGDDPINSLDPSGLFCLGSICTGFHPLQGLKGAINFAAGLANFGVSTITLGLIHISAPYCGYGLGTSYNIGNWTGDVEVGLAGGAEADSGAAGAESEGGTLNLSTEDSWGNQSSLQDHFDRHGPDFGSTSPDEYASQASQFLQDGLQGQADVKIDSNGVIRVYDPQTNTFGAYNPDGTTRTFFKPSSGAGYWANQPGSSPWGS